MSDDTGACLVIMEPHQTAFNGKVWGRGQPHPADGIYARKGEVTYCQNGHELGRLTRDVRCDDIASPTDFDIIPPMKYGDSECPHCGGSVTFWGCGYFFATEKP